MGYTSLRWEVGERAQQEGTACVKAQRTKFTFFFPPNLKKKTTVARERDVLAEAGERGQALNHRKFEFHLKYNFQEKSY